MTPTLARRLAGGLWGLLFLAITGAALLQPLKHTTMPTYRRAALAWWAGQDIYSYDSGAGFFYFPQAAILFSPFAAMPFYLGELLWRALAFALLAYGIARLCRIFPGGPAESWPRTYLFVSLLAIWSSLASLRNAQFDLPLAALIVLAAAQVGEGRWTRATVWLCLGVALKPLAVVPLLLFGALYRGRLLPRLAVGLILVALFPFLHWSPAYVAHEYARCAETLAWATQSNEPKFSDLGALAGHFGINLDNGFKTALRVVFALVYLGIGYAGICRLSRSAAAWLIGALAADYLMLFNPRTETCSFVMLAPFTATLAIFYARRGGHILSIAVLIFASLGLACDAIPVVHGLTDRWLKPLIALIFLPMLVRVLIACEAPLPEDSAARQISPPVR